MMVGCWFTRYVVIEWGRFSKTFPLILETVTPKVISGFLGSELFEEICWFVFKSGQMNFEL